MNAYVKLFLDSLTRYPTSSGVKFVSLEYVSKGTGEHARHLLNVGGSVENMYRKDVQTLETEIIPNLTGEELSVAKEILGSLKESLDLGIGNNSRYVHADTYTAIEGYPGVKYHNETGEISVSGILVHKKVITPGTYKEVKSRPRTIIKRNIESQLRKSKYRQFVIPMNDDRLMKVKVDGEILEL